VKRNSLNWQMPMLRITIMIIDVELSFDNLDILLKAVLTKDGF